MDPTLQENATKWLRRAERHHAENASHRDPYTAYFSYFIALLIIAKDHDNNLRFKSESEEKMLRKVFKDFPERILRAVGQPQLVSVTEELANRLGNLHPGSDQSIIYIAPINEAESSDDLRARRTKKSREDAIADMKMLAEYWSHESTTNDYRKISSCIFTFLWQVRNNLFHGQKGYGEKNRVIEDTKLLDRSCRLISAVVKEFIPSQ